MHLWKISTATFATLFAVTLAVHHIPSASAERQPQMQDALRALNNAANHLEKATADKGGHRVNALRLTKQAIAEVQAGIDFDNKR
jgi:hypothetical protein